MDLEQLEAFRKKLQGMEGLAAAAAAVRAAIEEVASGNHSFARGLSQAIDDLPDATPELKEMAGTLEKLAG